MARVLHPPAGGGNERIVGGSFAVGILDAQHKPALHLARVQPAKQSRTRTADVQNAGWARGESSFNHVIRSGSERAVFYRIDRRAQLKAFLNFEHLPGAMNTGVLEKRITQ